MAVLVACLGLVAFGAVLGVLGQAWIDRHLLSTARTMLWRTHRVSIATQHWSECAEASRVATERLKLLTDTANEMSQEHRRHAEEHWRRAAESEARADAALARARAMLGELTT